jgi:hypothetical protein
MYHPTLFTLTHPLNEQLPVLVHHGGDGDNSAHYAMNVHARIIHTDAGGSLVVMYDKRRCTHSLWTARTASVQVRARTHIPVREFVQDSLAAAQQLQNSMLYTTSAQVCIFHQLYIVCNCLLSA